MKEVDKWDTIPPQTVHLFKAIKAFLDERFAVLRTLNWGSSGEGNSARLKGTYKFKFGRALGKISTIFPAQRSKSKHKSSEYS